MAKHGVQKEQLRNRVSLVDNHVADAGGSALDAAAEQLRAQAETLWQRWEQEFAAVGPQIADIARFSRERIEREIVRMTNKGKRLVADRDAAIVKQLAEIEHWIWADGHLQERRLSPVSFIARFGSDWLRALPAWGDYDDPGVVYEIEL